MKYGDPAESTARQMSFDVHAVVMALLETEGLVLWDGFQHAGELVMDFGDEPIMAVPPVGRSDVTSTIASHEGLRGFMAFADMHLEP